MATNLDFAGPEVQVNVSPFQNNSQDDPDVAATTLGRFFVAYEDFNGVDIDIVGQFINADGTLDPVAVPFLEADNQQDPSVAQRADGSVAVVYEDNNHSATDPDVFLRVVSSTGTLGPEIEVAGDLVDAGGIPNEDPDIAMLADGREVVVYTHAVGGDDNLHLRVLNAAGTAFEAGFVDVNSGAGNQEDASVAASGSLAAIVYEDDSSGTNQDLRLQIFNGTTVGPVLTVADHSVDVQDADIAALADGRFVIVYEDDKPSNDDVFAKIYDPVTNTFSSEIIITNYGDNQDDAKVAGTPDGGFVVTWEDGSGNPDFADNDGSEAVHARRFDANGVPVGDEFLVNNTAPFTLDQDEPVVAVNSTGQVFFAYEDSEVRSGTGADTDPDGIRGHAAVLSNNPVNGTAGNDLITTYDLSEIVNGGDGIDVIDARGGNDTVNGGLGNDLLTLGLGADILLFNTAIKPAANIDTVTDFNPIDDIMQLDDAIFTKLDVGALKGKAFHIGKAAHDANDRIIYNDNSGALYYDKNGDAAGKVFQIATLAPHLDLTKADFLIV